MVNYKKYNPEVESLYPNEQPLGSTKYYFDQDHSVTSYNKTPFQLKNKDQPDLFSNQFDVYFIDPNNNTLSDFVKYIFSDKNFDMEGPVKDIFERVSSIDSLAVRCSGITLPGYTLETTTLATPSWEVEVPTGLINVLSKGSISFRLDKHAALADIFSTLSGKFDTIKMFDLAGQEFNASGTVPQYVTNLFQHKLNSTTPYSLSDLGLCLVVTMNATKRFPILGKPNPRVESQRYAVSGHMPMAQIERKYNEFHTNTAGNNTDYGSYYNSFPIYIFENIKIIGVTSDISLSSSWSDPQEITVDFIYRRFRLTHNKSPKLHKFKGENYLGIDSANDNGYDYPNGLLS